MHGSDQLLAICLVRKSRSGDYPTLFSQDCCRVWNQPYLADAHVSTTIPPPVSRGGGYSFLFLVCPEFEPKQTLMGDSIVDGALQALIKAHKRQPA